MEILYDSVAVNLSKGKQKDDLKNRNYMNNAMVRNFI